MITFFLLYCKAYHAFNKDERYYYLRKILKVGCEKLHAINANTFSFINLFSPLRTKKHGLCVSQVTAAVINITAVLIILPVCKTFNKIIHKIFSNISINMLAFYLQKLKVVHQFFAMTLVFTSRMCEPVDQSNQ